MPDKMADYESLLGIALTCILAVEPNILKHFVKLIFQILYTVLAKTVEYIPVIVITILLYVWGQPEKNRGRRRFAKRTRKYNIMSPYCFQMVDEFEDRAGDLAPSHEYLREGRRTAHRIFEQLKQNCGAYNYKIGRTLIAGSFGKGTGISYETEDDFDKNPDLDLIIYLNEQDSQKSRTGKQDSSFQLQRVFEDFKSILEDLDGLKGRIRVKKYSIQFVVETDEGDIKTDLLVAKNYLKNTQGWAGTDVGVAASEIALRYHAEQHGQCREEAQINENNKIFSPAFAEKTVQIINNEVLDRFVLKVVRLAKYWTANINFPSDYPPPRSCMIELLAICAQRRKGKGKRGRNGERCIVSGVRRFLESVRDLKTLEVSLTDINNRKDVPAAESFPMIRDPVNPINNLAFGLHPTMINILVTQAKKTILMIDELKKGVDYENFENAIDEIFSHKY